MFDIFRRHAKALLWAAILTYGLFFSAVSVFRYRHFFYGDWDLATYNQIMRGFLEGHPYTTLGGIRFFGNHAEAGLLLFLPLYALCPHPATLLVLQSFALSLAAVPLFFIGRMVSGERVALMFCFLYLFYPPLGHVNLYEFHPECLLPLIQFSLFYFFLRRNWGMFLLFMALCLFAKENMPLIVIMFGVLAAVQKRPLRWILVPLIAGGAWFILYVKWIQPYLSQGRMNFGYIYAHMGDSLPAVAWFMVTHPLKVLFWLTRGHVGVYLLQVFAPLSFMSIFAPGLLALALPNFLQHLLSRRLTETNIGTYYAAEFMAFIFIAAIFGSRRLWDFFRPRLRALFAVFLAANMIWPVFFSPQARLAAGFTRSLGVDETRTRSHEMLLRAVPRDAGVVATFSFLPELSRRPGHLESFHKVLTGEYYPGQAFALPPECRFALIDFEDKKTFGDFFRTPASRENFKRFFSEGRWGVRMAAGNAVLFEMDAPGGDILPRVVPWASDPEPAAFLGGRLALLRMDRERVFMDGQEAVRLIFFWKHSQAADIDYGMKLTVRDSSGKVVWHGRHSIGYQLLAASAWKEGEVVREAFQFLWPRDAGPGPWEICLTLVDKRSGTLIPLTGGGDAVRGKHEVCFSFSPSVEKEGVNAGS